MERDATLNKKIFVAIGCMVVSRKLRRKLARLVQANDFIGGWDRCY